MKRWSSTLNFILATTGAAVGLGSIWKFPYVAGMNGGGAFVLITFIATLVIALPAMIAEITLGKMQRCDSVSTIESITKENNLSKAWKYLGYMGLCCLVLILSFYSVVSGWSLAYIFKLLSFSLQNKNLSELSEIFTSFISSPFEMTIYHAIFLYLNYIVVIKGIKSGLEKASKIMMPTLFCILIFLMCYALRHGNTATAFSFLLSTDFSKLTATSFIEAIGQASFSLATGVGCMLVYGSYIPDKTKIVPNSLMVALCVLGVSIISGLAIFPLVFAHNLPPTSGPGLMFISLPLAFNSMPYGIIIGSLFFLALWFAAWTSSISLCEPVVATLAAKTTLSRQSACKIVSLVAFTLGLLSILSFNLLSDIQIFHQNFFDLIVNLSTNILLPIGALGFSILTAWHLDKNKLKSAIATHPLIFKAWYYSLKYVVSTTILLTILL